MNRTMKTYQEGFTLAEIVVSIFVLATGVLCAAGMQLSALRTSQQAAVRTAGLQIATAIADRVRTADRRSGNPDTALVYQDVDYRASDPASPGGAECFASSCNAVAMAGVELEEWKVRVRKELPGGRLQICRYPRVSASPQAGKGWECAAGNDARDGFTVIRVGWQDRADSRNARSGKPNGDAPPAIVIMVDQGAI